MSRTMHAPARAGVAALLLAGACGGAPEGPKNAHAGGAGKTGDDDFSNVASREGLPSLGPTAGQQGGATGGSLRLDLADKDNPIYVDGVPKEWTLVPALTVAKGSSDGLKFSCGLAYDAQRVYFAGDVTGVKLRHLRRFTADEDHATLDVAAPGAAPVEVTFFAGKPGELAGVVRIHGRSVPGARIVEAEKDDGYTFEAALPWSAVAPATVRVGLRGVAAFHDGTRAVLATGDGDASSPRDMPALPTASERALVEMFLAPKGLLQTQPKFELLADITGDAMKERIAVYDRYLTVVGPTYREGKEFFYRDLGAEVTGLEARDVTGRAKKDLVLHRRFAGATTREWLDVWTFFGDEPTSVFSHEVAVASGSKRVADAVRLGRGEIDVTYEPAAGWDASTYDEPTASDTEPVIVPWGKVKSQTFRFDGKTFAKAREVAQAGVEPRNKRTTATGTTTTTPATAITRVEPPTPPQRAGGDLSAQLLARYRADRGVPATERPRVDIQVQVDGDSRPERVLLIGRDLVIFGPGFKGGTGYAYFTLSQFAEPSDIDEVTARDVTGDGRADLVVRGVRHMNAQLPGGRNGRVDSHVMFVYQVKSEALTRVFGVETARSLGAKRVQGLVQLVPGRGNRGFEVDVRPGRAVGWTRATYPFTQDPPGGSLEPLLLPWGGIDHLRFAFNGTTFAPVP